MPLIETALSDASRIDPEGRLQVMEDKAVTDTVRRLAGELRGTVHHDLIVRVVHRSCHDLEPPSPGAFPELLERLARERLLQYLAEN
jgi:hypothetical protein